MYYHCKLLIGLGLIAGVLLMAQPSSAQDTRVLSIRDGTVYVDGEPLPKKQMPPELQTEGLNLRMQFHGVEEPILTIRGRRYVLKPDRLEHLAASDSASSSIGGGIAPQHVSTATPRSGRTRSAAAASGLSSESVRRGYTRAASQTKYEEYLRQLRRRNTSLYQGLHREMTLEEQSRQLARRLQQAASENERERLRRELRTTLRKAFTLKQENRRREIEVMQRKVEQIRETLEERERQREQIIRQRFEALTSPSENRP